MSAGMSVIARFAVVGYHSWPQAPDVVAYLRYPHRHVFGFRVKLVCSTTIAKSNSTCCVEMR